MDREIFEKEIGMCRKLAKKNGRCNWGECAKCGVIPFLYKIAQGKIYESEEEVNKIKQEIIGVSKEKAERQLPVVIALIRNKEGKILLQKRTDPFIPKADGKWEFPGGRVEFGENPQDAIRRECLEEIGCEVKVGKISPLINSVIWETADGGKIHALVTCYEAELVKGTAFSADKKVAEVRWFLEEEIKNLDTLKGTKDFLRLSKK